MITRNDAINIMENTIARLIKEGIMDVDDDVNSDSMAHIWDNNKVVIRILQGICGEYPHFMNCDIDGYDAYVDFGNLYVIVNVSEDGYMYVSKVEGSADDKNMSNELWSEVTDCINKINGFGKKISEVTVESKKRRAVMESFTNNQNYSHFAVNKATNKIVNGWDYWDYDADELKSFKRDYFINDLIDYDLDPKQYKIVTGKYLIKQGIDPNDNNNWANN